MYLHGPMPLIAVHIHNTFGPEGLKKLEAIKDELVTINLKLTTMGENLNQIKADLVAANEKADKIQADVTLLHSKIDGVTGETPTAEEWAEVKQLSTDLNNKMQGIDDQTPEETTEPVE